MANGGIGFTEEISLQIIPYVQIVYPEDLCKLTIFVQLNALGQCIFDKGGGQLLQLKNNS